MNCSIPCKQKRDDGICNTNIRTQCKLWLAKFQEGVKSVENEDNFAIPIANMEQNTCYELLGAEEAQGLDTQCCIHIHSKRKRLADPDGISAKAVIDGLCKAGILADDSAKYIKSVTFSQEKADKEETIIEISW